VQHVNEHRQTKHCRQTLDDHKPRHARPQSKAPFFERTRKRDSRVRQARRDTRAGHTLPHASCRAKLGFNTTNRRKQRNEDSSLTD
jgi:hypothetical protein